MQKKPEWIRIRVPAGSGYKKVRGILEKFHLNTVCDEALCPNRGKCFQAGTATFMILGKNCTRNCRFCNVTSAKPEEADPDEPGRVAAAVEALKLKYVVITSVTRDDLPDGGAFHFADVIKAIKRKTPGVGIEVLIPDFQGDREALSEVVEAGPDVIAHNVETVPSLYDEVRPQANYAQSLEVISDVKGMNPGIKSKSGLMVGLGETREQVIEVMKDLRTHGCEFLTIGQYLAPSKLHHPVIEYITPAMFDEYAQTARDLGFEYVASAPFVRSSYMAREAFQKDWGQV
jgi:lipoic acid synthetase